MTLHQHDAAQSQLDRRRQARRVNDRPHVMFDETAAITGLPGCVAHEVFPLRQRAGQVEDFHRHAPHSRGQVPPGQGAPFEHQQPAEQHEQNEQQVEQDQPVGPGSGMNEYFAEQMIGGAYRGSSLPDFNPLLHRPAENPLSQIGAIYLLAVVNDTFGFYDGDLALHRLLLPDTAVTATLEIQSVKHCDHEASALARFLVEP